MLFGRDRLYFKSLKVSALILGLSHDGRYPEISVCKSYVTPMGEINITKLMARKPCLLYGTLARYAKLRVAHAPGIPGTFFPLPRVSDPDMHHGTCVTHVPWCMPGPLTNGFLWSQWRGKCSRHSRRMHNTQFYRSGKRFMRYIARVVGFACAKFPKQERYHVWGGSDALNSLKR